MFSIYPSFVPWFFRASAVLPKLQPVQEEEATKDEEGAEQEEDDDDMLVILPPEGSGENSNEALSKERNELSLSGLEGEEKEEEDREESVRLAGKGKEQRSTLFMDEDANFPGTGQTSRVPHC